MDFVFVMQNKKISVIHVAETVKGGVESYISELVSLQQKDGFIISLIAPNNDINCQKITVRAGWRLAKVFKILLHLVKQIVIYKPDVVHLHSSFAGLLRVPIAIVSTLFQKRLRIVYCAHGWAFNICDIGRAKRLVIVYVERFLYMFTDEIICISKSDYESAIDCGFCEKKIHRVDNGISISSLCEDDKPSGRGLKNNSYINLLFVGRFDRQKGLDVLLRAFQRCSRKDLRLTIVGDYVIGEKNDEIEACRNDKRITWKGWVHRDSINRYYLESDATILPSRWEGCGLVALESLRASTPVLCSKVGGLKDICNDGETGYLFDLDEGVITNLLDAISKTALLKMRAKSYERFYNFFSSVSMHKKIKKIYGV